jgi:ApaG protein
VISALTNDIKVSVKTAYQAEFSNPAKDLYIFSYTIRIQNMSNYTVKLLSRYWDILDAMGFERTVEGPGVVGEQPELEPNEYFDYSSSCHLSTQFGQMSGFYTFRKNENSELFEVEIPQFQLEVPFMLS